MKEKNKEANKREQGEDDKVSAAQALSEAKSDSDLLIHMMLDGAGGGSKASLVH